MQLLFEYQDLWGIAEKGFEELDEYSEVSQARRDAAKYPEKKDAKARCYIFQSIDASISRRLPMQERQKHMGNSNKLLQRSQGGWESEITNSKAAILVTTNGETREYI